MYTMISTEGLSRRQWLDLRKTGIGGSDAGAICGLNPFASPMSVYLDKTGSAGEDADSEAMRQGRDLEEYVARRFMEAAGKKVRRSNRMYRSAEWPFMIADVDRLVVGENAGLECKTASAYNADKWKNGEVPTHYLVQCHHYMAVTGKEAWYIAVVILGQGFQFAKISRDEELIANLVTVEERFWKDHVLVGKMPDPDGSKACDEVLNRYFGRARKASSIPLIGFDEKLKRREELEALIGKLEREQRQIDQEIKLYMKECETAFTDHFRVNWTNVETERLDTKRLKSEEPRIYESFLKVTPSRRFTVKAA